MNSELVVPDGGRGWAVVGGTAIINMFNQSLLSMFGLIFGAKLESLAGTTGVTTVMSVNCAVSNFSGLLTSPLSKYFTTRFITQCSVFMVATGLILSAYIENYWVIILGYGALSGLGLGLISSSTFLIVNSYFNNYKSFAVASAMAGTSMGQMGLPPVVAYLLRSYGYSHTVTVMACLSMIGVLGAMAFDPVEKHMITKQEAESRNSWITRFSSRLARFKKRLCCDDNKDDLEKVVTHYQEQTIVERLNDRESDGLSDGEDKVLFNKYGSQRNSQDFNGVMQVNPFESSRNLNGKTEKLDSFESDNDVEKYEGKQASAKTGSSATTAEADRKPDDDEENENEDREGAPSATCWQNFVKFFDLNILLDPRFVHIMIGLSLAYTTSISFSTFFPLFLTEDLNMTEIQASTCMSTLSLMDLLGRFAVPLVSRYLNASHRMTFLVSSYFLAACRSTLAMQTDYTMVLLLSAICGLARAATVINQNLVIAEYSKETHVAAAVGLNMVSKGIFIFTIGRLLGEFKDAPGHKFSTCIHILDFISVGVALSWSLELILTRVCGIWRRRKRL